MSEELRIFLACLASAPVVAAFFTLVAAMTDGSTFDDPADAGAFWLALTSILLGVVAGVGALYFTWEWAL